ncbi:MULTISPECIES: PAS domain S-box protein [unclassified Pseudomonas]|uniref:PAS domain S-box protein n=2 Tax=Pseudomonas TaxID=286 RepID=UPI002ACB1856|nr:MULTISPECIES: PAS domain S-box protein [unclassified Pseudomonas]MEA9977348.1 PAS domain S-box protein [Pseudomonas sp. RTS4]MEA9993190.1 PAS domain S-box protein [Pseudomonas sp. AA4]MEB0043597.1 PAS domain S-box protein [Pseudomonas sp. MH10]MEB0089261.1 PAS domain S-box protein [Pseudomonas sp. RTI1]MEB0092951.1 PAS domain S-box protein [Pseudomonas sp. CCI4.2]
MKKGNQPPLLGVYTLGTFLLSLAPLAEELNAQGSTLITCTDVECLPLLRNSDCLLSELTWLESLEDLQHTLLLDKTRNCNEWIVITDDHSTVVQQRYWIGMGAHHLIHQRSSLEQLIGRLNLNQPEKSALPKILLLSDDVHADLLVDALNEEGLEIILNREVDHALQTLGQVRPDVLIIDLTDACSHVLEIAEIAKQWPETDDLPVIALFSEDCIFQLRQAKALVLLDWHAKQIAPGLLADIAKQRAGAAQNRRRSHQTCVKDAERARARLKNFRHAIDQHSTVSLADTQGRILHVSHSFCEISGYSRAELIGKTHRIVKSGIHPHEFYQDMWMTIRCGKIWHGEVCNRRKDGQLYWVETTIVPFLNEQGKPIQYISIRTDMTQHKANETALRVSHECLQRSQIAGRVGTWEFDMRSRAFQLSSSMIGLFGRTEEFAEVSYETFLSLIHTDDLPHVLNSINRMLSNIDTYEVEHRAIWPDGSWHWLLQRGEAEFDANGRAIRLFGVTQDIHALKIVEQTLQESELRFRSAFDSSGIGMALIGLDGRWLQLNQTLCAMFDFSNDELLKSFPQAIIHPDDLNHYQEVLNRFICNDCVPQQFENRYFTKGGRTVIAELNISLVRNADQQPLHFVCQVQDITQRKAAEHRLTLFGQIFESSEQCIGIFDDRCHMFYQNRALRIELGYEDVDLLGQNFKNFIVDKESPSSKKLLRSISEGRNWQGQLPLRRKNGSEFISNSCVGLVKDEQGQFQYGFNIFTDFSEEIARHRELGQAKVAANAANQAKTDFLSSMSHELRTPMNAILGFAQMLECDDSLGADQLDSVREILNGGDHLLALINEILDLAKIESSSLTLSIEPVALHCIVAECWSLIQPLADARDLSTHFFISEEIIVKADRMRLKQVLLNLLSNAVKYNRVGGQITLKATPCDVGMLRIEVSDTGMGIPATRIDELFQPFSRLDAEYSEIEGTGIGLSIAKRLVKLMGGSIGVNSIEGQGSTFWLELYADEALTQSTTIEPDCIRIRQAGNNFAAQRVLCVDDNPINLKLISTYFKKHPHIQVLTASSPAQGLEIALTQTPDLILLDINMPEMDGYQLLAILQSDPRTRVVPVIAVTANAMPSDVERAQQAGFDSYLTKPINFHQLLEILNRHLNLGVEELA